ncbi:MAG: 8-oxoguanine deaminase [Pseudomonadota bacterium]
MSQLSASTTDSTTWVTNAAAIWTDGESLPGASLVVQGNQVREVLAPGETPSIRVTTRIDATDCVILPGLVNCHHHFYQTLTRAFPSALNKELFDWLVALYPVWAGLDEEAISVSTTLALAELMLSGCTLASDHHYVFSDNTTLAIDRQFEAAEALGVRVVLTRGSMSRGESLGGLPPDRVVQTPDVILEDSERLIGRYHDPDAFAMQQLALAPCSPFSVTDELMRDSATLARRHGVRLHTHLAETEDENDFCLETVGMRPLDYIESLGWLADDVWFAHGIHFNDDEISRLGAAGVGVSHCPCSNMLLSSGICPVSDLEHAGVSVGIGVDGSASNDVSNMIGEVRQALLLQKLRYGSAAISHHDALRWATRGGADLFGRAELGSLRPGMAADFGIYALDTLNFSGHGDPVAALLLCGATKVRDLMINGEWRVRHGEIPGLDIEDLKARHRAAAKRLAG